MSSTFVADTTDDCKTDNTLIIIVNNDGTISVDQETLQNLLANQQNAPVSVVRVGAASQGDDNSQDSNGTCDSQNDGNPHVNLTVEGFYPQVTPQAAGAEGALPSVGETPLDPFLEMDPEQLERLETALQSEQAKQILGENVTAMLDMLSVEEEASKLKDTIRMDHCYTNLSPSSAPSVLPSSNTVISNQNDGDTASSNDEEQVKVTSSSGRGSVRGTRGRGRGPGRPRKDGSISRPTTSYRGGAGRGGVRGQSTRGGTANHVLMQQMQHITPPPNAPSATLVPLIKPLVLPSNASSTVTLSSGQTFAHKQILPVQSGGGARFVTLAAKSSGQNVTSGQQRILVTNNSTVQLQTLKIPISQSAGQVTTSSASSTNSGSQSPQVTSSTLTSGVGQAKVLVAKMPSIPPQLLGAQPTTANVDGGKIISKNNLSEDDTEFSKFSQDEESEETDEADTDDEDFMIMSNKRNVGRGGRPRPRGGRRTRFRGTGRGWLRGRVVRGFLKQRGLGRGGRGSGRSEDLSQVHKLDSEMASALIAMSRSPEPEEPARESSEKGSPTKSSEGDKDREDANTSFSPDVGKKKLKIAIKISSKRKSEVGGIEVPNQEFLTEKKEDNTVTVVSKDEKVNAVKVSPTKHGEDAQAKQLGVAEQKPDSRKNYPKRENRKPPAHLAEALGPALFSTPDIIRRVSTGSENKSVLHSPTDSKDETGMGKSESLSQDIILSSTSDKVNETTELPSPVSKKKVDDTSIKDEVAQEKTEKVDGKSNLNTIQPDEVNDDIKSEHLLMESSPVNSHRTEGGGAVRPNRKRNIQIRLDGLLKKDPSLKNQSQGKDKKSRNVKTKGRGRRRSPDLKIEESDEDEDQSSDDESWNSEDDPDRLWCICKKPHNNRFMICCDSCEDWFHGKCVGITKAMGKQMENKGLEWTCPNCSEKKQTDEKVKDVKRKVFKEKDVKKYIREAVKDKEETSDSHSHGSSDNKKDISEEQTNQVSRSSLNEAGMFCIVCKKAARTSSIYCSDECILKHAKESLSEKGVQSANKLNQTIAVKTTEPNSSQLPKARLDARVMVFERKTGKLLSGPNAPTVSNLKSWLKDNPTFEIVRPGDANTKILTSKQSLMSKYMESKEDGSAVAIPGQPKFNSSQQSKKGILVQQKISQLLQKPPQTKLLTNTQLQANENSQPKSAAPSKPPASPHKGAVSQKGVIVLGKPVQPTITSPKSVSAKGLKQTILIPVETVHKIGIRTYSKSPKSTPKSPVLTSPTKTQNVVPKSTPPQVVSKVPATSTVKDPEKVIVRKIEMKRTSVEPNKKEKDEEKEKEKPPGPEPIRLNVRKTLQELLQMRIQECDDLVVPEEDIQTIALHIEEEMHSYFRDTGIKYKSKYRSLVFNIKDPKNLTLFRKIADKSVTPYQLVRLSPEELASQELAQWRERETKHQIEWIKKNELDMLSLSKTYVMKTHKGEQVIEADDSLKVEVPDLVDPAAETEVRNVSNNSVTSTVEDGKLSSKKDKSKSKEKSKDSKSKNKKEEKEKSHEKDKSKSVEKKNKEKSEKGKKDEDESNKREHRHHRGDGDHERHRSSRRERRGSESKSHDHEKRKDYKSESSHREKKEDSERQGREVSGDIELMVEESNETKGEAQSTTDIKETVKDEDATMSFSVPSGTQIDSLEDTDPSDREPTSTVSIKTPDINVDETDPNVVMVWKGFVNMPDVAKFFTSVQVVSGDPQNLSKDLPESVDIVGRIMPNTVWDYISKMKKTGTKEILVIRLIAANDEEKIPYITLYTYLNSRNRLGVVGNCSKMIKDFYIMPLPSYEQVPQVLLPLRGPGFEDYRPHLLLGIIVRSKRKRLAPENEYIAKVPKRMSSDGSTEVSERSYTPPLPNTDAEKAGSLTPPHPHPSTSDSYTPPLSPTQSFYSVSQHHDARRKWVERRDSEKSSVDDLNVVEKHGGAGDAAAKHKSSFSDDEDADAPYSPGGSDDDDIGDSSEDNLLSTPKSSSELERKMEELNRKIEEQKQQIQCISSAIVGSDTTVSSGSIQMKSVMQSYMMATSRKSEDPDESEAYSPSRSFTPPPSTPSVLTSLTSNISIPSNLQEILASIKKQETVISSGSSKGINLKTDPIVQNYGSAQPEAESIPISESHYTSSTYTVRKSETASALSQTQLQSASSALLSLSTPVIHTLHSSDSKTSRDPRQRGSLTPETANKVAGSTLSTLSDDDLIKKAAEMMEMEKIDSSDKAASSGKLFHSSGVESGIHTSLQPLPPGVEDDYSSYSGSYSSSSQQPLSPSKHGVSILPSGAIKYPTPHGAVVSYPVSHHYKPPPPPPPSTPPPPPPPPPPPSAYNLSHSSSKELGYSSSYQPQTQGGYAESRKLLPRKKRKYDDGPGGSDMKRDRGKSPGLGGREIWDTKMPPHMRGRYGMRGRGYMRGNRGFMRQRGGRSSEHNQMRWDGQSDKHFNRRKSPRYDAGIRSEWDMHIKDFEEKHRERSRQLRHNRDRDRRDRSSGSSQRSSRSGSRRNRDSNSP